MNKKSLIFGGVFAGLSLLFLILCVIPCIEGYSILTYALLCLSAGQMYTMMGIIMLLPFIFNLIVLIFSVLSILTSCNVIKSTKAGKAFRIVEIVFASITTFFSAAVILVLFALSQSAQYITFPVILAVVAIAMIVLSAIDLHILKKAEKQLTA